MNILDAQALRDEIIEVLVLFGGRSTRIEKVQTTLSEIFPQNRLNKSVNPDEAIW